MQLWSQHDPAIEKIPLPLSSLTMVQAGCFVCSIANLAQVSPVDLLKVPNGFVAGGLLAPSVLAGAVGMFYVGPAQLAPKGWCIGRTDYYAKIGFPTHFLCVNMDTRQMIDPLRYPARIEPLTYDINQYRAFTGVRLATTVDPPPFEAPFDPALPDWAQHIAVKAQKAGITTPLTDAIGSLPIYQVLLLIEKYISVTS